MTSGESSLRVRLTLEFQVVPAGKLVFKVSQWGVDVERLKEDKRKKFKGEVRRSESRRTSL